MITSQQNTPSIRYIHAPDVFDTTECPISGLTVLYYRVYDFVGFSYALCHKNDKYSKAVGRLTTQMAQRKVCAHYTEFPGEFPVDGFIDTIRQNGMITIDTFAEDIGRMNVFSDQSLKCINVFDLKHSYISRVLYDLVVEQAVFSRYPNA